MDSTSNVSKERRQAPPLKAVVRDFSHRAQAHHIEIEGASAKVCLASATVSDSDVLGYGCWLKTSLGEIFMAYFAGSRLSAQSAPEYDRQLWMVLGATVFDLSTTEISLDLHQSLCERTFTVCQHGRVVSTFSYEYPMIRGLANKLLGDPFLAEPDLPEVVVDLARSIGRRA
jgi:hypothetical protein